MQILKRLFKVAQQDQQERQNTPNKDGGEKAIGRDIILYKNRRSKNKKLKPFIFICNKDSAKACFDSSIYVRRVSGCEQYWEKSMKMKKDDDLAGNKVVPMNESAATVKTKKNDEKKDKNSKTLSRMKELLRWAAAAKSDRGSIGRKLKKRGAASVKSVEDEISNESPKISLRWDVQSCSSSVISATSLKNYDDNCNINVSINSIPFPLNRCSSRRGNWITTDSEFVVLEL